MVIQQLLRKPLSNLQNMEEIMNRKAFREETLLWEPSDEYVRQANVSRYMEWLKAMKGLEFNDYFDLWDWSVKSLEDFWASIWEFFEIKASKSYSRVLNERKMPGSKWFEGAELNYTENVFRNISADRPALIFQSELQPLSELSWQELYQNVSSVAASLRNMGVRRGDRVAGYMPNIPETLVTFLACASIGAVWACCSPDFGSRSVLDRFEQIAPKVLFAIDGYLYGGKGFDRRPMVSELQNALKTVEKTILVPCLEKEPEPVGLRNVVAWKDLLAERSELIFEQVPFDHPLWVVYSSGTTGLPKGIVHSHGGALVELYKYLGLHVDVKPGSRFLWFCTTGWVMWNQLQGGLLLGGTPVLYDGNPGYPNMEVLWKMAQEAGLTIFGTSPAYIKACMDMGLEPGRDFNLDALKEVGVTGAPLPPEAFQWIYEHVKKDVWLASVSGGTDVASAFLGCSPVLPVNIGESQCRCLGVKVEAFDEKRNSLVGEVGEMVITEPMPSMPLFFWNDPENRRYKESYFQMFPGVWRHGDWLRISSRGTAVVTGRSDSTLKKMGVRMGSGEIYSAVEEIPEIAGSLIIGMELENGKYFMPLFVTVQEGQVLDDSLKKRINNKIRDSLTARHVPDDIFAVTEIPMTLNGKKMEVPVKKILMGEPFEKAANIDSMRNPHSLDYFVEMAQKINNAD